MMDADSHHCQNGVSQLKVHKSAQFSLNLATIRELFHSQKLFLNQLLPNNRSFSQPELRTDLISDFKSFRDVLLENTRKVHNGPLWVPSNGYCSCSRAKSRCEKSASECDEDSPPPVPKPRKSVLRRRQTREAAKVELHTAAASEEKDILSTDATQVEAKPKEVPGKVNCSVEVSSNVSANECPSNVPQGELPSAEEAIYTENCLPVPREDRPNGAPLLIASEQTTLLPSHLSHAVSAPVKSNPSIKVKTKQSFRQQLLRINRIASNKFLSLRLKDGRKKTLFSMNGNQPPRPCRPTRPAPPPPILVFRPAAPLPQSDIDSCDDNLSTATNGAGFDGDDVSELYHDAFNAEDLEGIYCSVDEVAYMRTNTTIPEENARKQGLVRENWNHSGGSDGGRRKDPDDDYDETAEEEYDYYDDGECIYEELSSNEGTIYEEFIEEENVYGNADAEVDRPDKVAEEAKNQMKRLKKARKIMKRFNLTGDEIPVNAGIVKRDQKGSHSNLKVRASETVLILRMTGNPPGLWLAKNERSKIGYVDLDNVCIDPEGIKTLMKVISGFHNAIWWL